MARAVAERPRTTPHVRRVQIRDEAIRIIGERGYNGFTVQDLAARCGLSNAGLLHHFATKDHLLVAVLEEIKRRETQILAPIIDRAEKHGEHDPAAIFELLHTIVKLAAEAPEILRLVATLRVEALDPGHPAHAEIHARDAAAFALFRRLLSPYYADPMAMARRVSALIEGMAMQWTRAGQAFDLSQEWSHAADDLLSALHKNQKKRNRQSLIA